MFYVNGHFENAQILYRAYTAACSSTLIPLHGCSHRSQADNLAGHQSVGVLLSAPDCLCILAADSVLQLTPSTEPHKRLPPSS